MGDPGISRLVSDDNRRVDPAVFEIETDRARRIEERAEGRRTDDEGF